MALYIMQFYILGILRPNIVLGIHSFVDTEWDGDLDHKISTSGYIFKLFGGAISWMSKRHVLVVL